MAHTLTEQELDTSASTTPIEDIHNLFVRQFGYTQSGDYYFSPIDTNFGVRWYIDSNYIYCAVTFDGGATETEFVKQTIQYTNSTFTKIYYHVSKNEKVIYLRIICKNGSSGNHSVGVIIAHDDKNKTVCFKGYFNGSTSSGNSSLYMLDSKKTVYTVEQIGYKEYRVKSYIPNAIYRYPSLGNYSMLSELYAVINVQSFDSLSDTYINFGGQLYRVICCFDTVISSSSPVFTPYFAFPVAE